MQFQFQCTVLLVFVSNRSSRSHDVHPSVRSKFVTGLSALLAYFDVQSKPKILRFNC